MKGERSGLMLSLYHTTLWKASFLKKMVLLGWKKIKSRAQR